MKIGDKWGYIDKTGKIVIEPKYDNNASYFSEDLAGERVVEKWDFIDKTGEIIRQTKSDNTWKYTDEF